VRVGESQGSRDARVEALEAGERVRGTVVPPDASLALRGGVNPGLAGGTATPDVGMVPLFGLFCGVEDVLSKPVRTVARLLSTLAAAAVFLFASARSRSSMVSCPDAFVVSALADVSFRQPAITAKATINVSDGLKNTFMMVACGWSNW